VKKLEAKLVKKGGSNAPPAAQLRAAMNAKRKRPDADEEDSEDDGAPLFQVAPSRGSSIQEVSRATPGLLLQAGLRQMAKHLGTREGATEDELSEFVPRVVTYLTSVFHGHHPQSEVGVRNVRELRTLAACLDALLRGDVENLGDILMQRFKAVESASVKGDWGTSSQLELIDETGLGLTTTDELTAATKQEALRLKLDELREKNAKARSSGKRPGG